MRLLEKIRKKQARACVMGLGYVGLPLALELARAGYRVVGLDANPDRVLDLRDAKSHVMDVSSETLSEVIETSRLEFTCDDRALGEADVIIICVPTRSARRAIRICPSCGPPWRASGAAGGGDSFTCSKAPPGRA